MNGPVDDFLASLVGARDWNPQFAQIRDWAAADRADDLLAIGAALTDDAQTPGVELVVRQSVFDALERTLALTPGLSQTEAAWSLLTLGETQRLCLSLRRTLAQRQADTASLFAQAQPPDVLAALFARHGAEPQHLEMLACLAQEMVLRGTSIPDPTAEFWEHRVVDAEHPLARLPLRLLPPESAFRQFLPQHGPQTQSWSSPALPAEEIKPLPAPIEMSIRWMESELSAEEKANTEAAAANWEQESNGKLETRLFRADVVVPAEAVTDAQVLSLPLECLAGATKLDLWLVPYCAADAVAVLFSAASTGGAYNRGLGGAYGRLAAWRSAGALAGSDSSASVEDTAALAGACAWSFCIAKSEWFYDVAWDLGLLALRPDGRTLAVLAATDTD